MIHIKHGTLRTKSEAYRLTDSQTYIMQVYIIPVHTLGIYHFLYDFLLFFKLFLPNRTLFDTHSIFVVISSKGITIQHINK